MAEQCAPTLRVHSRGETWQAARSCPAGGGEEDSAANRWRSYKLDERDFFFFFLTV